MMYDRLTRYGVPFAFGLTETRRTQTNDIDSQITISWWLRIFPYHLRKRAYTDRATNLPSLTITVKYMHSTEEDVSTTLSHLPGTLFAGHYPVSTGSGHHSKSMHA